MNESVIVAEIVGITPEGCSMYHSSILNPVPNDPGIYALYDGINGNKCVYVGKSGKLKTRVRDHLILQISTVASGTAGASLNIENLTKLKWWTHPNFTDDSYLDAFETLAFTYLDPQLRSRGGRLKSGSSYLDNPHFKELVNDILKKPSGEVELLSYGKLYKKIEEIELRLSRLENSEE